MSETHYFIRPMVLSDLDKVVEIHLKSFPDFFLTFLGPSFLKLLYREILNAADHVAFVAQDEAGSTMGFVVGVCHQSGFYARLARRRWLGFAVASLRAVMRRPAIILRLFRALGYSQASQAATAQALLMSIAVAPHAAGHGVGQQLVTHFLMAMKQKQVTGVSLTTDRDANERTNRFYQHFGFQLARTYVTPEGRGMNEYVLDLTTWTPVMERQTDVWTL